MKLRPHHVLDIISGYGQGVDFMPHPYGHAVHTVARSILSDLDLDLEFMIGADEICRPCTHLRSDGRCDDVLSQLDPPISKQKYNDDLDKRLLDYLGLATSSVMTVRKYLEIVAKNLPGVEKICTHPGEDQEARLCGLQHGLARLGIAGDVCLDRLTGGTESECGTGCLRTRPFLH
jgi:hypothetical protein